MPQLTLFDSRETLFADDERGRIAFRLDPAPGSTPAAILDAAGRVMDSLGVPFNSVGLNLYRDGRDSVAPHNDHLNEISKGFPIALSTAE